MANNSASLRTTLSRIRGLGASGTGTEHFWLQRVTALANVFLVIAFICIVIAAAGRDYAVAISIVGHPLVSILLVLLVLSVTVHMRIGLAVVIEDYVHEEGWKIAAVVLNNFFSVAVAVAAIFAILKISLARLV